MIIELYSKRLKKKSPNDEIFEYECIPNKLRIQIYHIWKEGIGNDGRAWEFIHNNMIKELGTLKLGKTPYNSVREGCEYFLLKHDVVEEVLDIIELSFRVIDGFIRKSDKRACYLQMDRKLEADKAIADLNYRFRENAVGYEYLDGKVIRIDRKFTHNEITKPAIKLLYEEAFDGSSNEFLEAHRYYREVKYKEAILYAGKAFESTMKTICERMPYEYKPKSDTANKLISILCENDFIPMSMKTHYESLDKVLSGVRTSLDTGLPTLRNRRGGHGQGEEVIYVPEHFVTYALNLAAANIVMLVNIYKDKKK